MLYKQVLQFILLGFSSACQQILPVATWQAWQPCLPAAMNISSQKALIRNYLLHLFLDLSGSVQEAMPNKTLLPRSVRICIGGNVRTTVPFCRTFMICTGGNVRKLALLPRHIMTCTGGNVRKLALLPRHIMTCTGGNVRKLALLPRHIMICTGGRQCQKACTSPQTYNDMYRRQCQKSYTSPQTCQNLYSRYIRYKQVAVTTMSGGSL